MDFYFNFGKRVSDPIMHPINTIAAIREGDAFIFSELFNEYHQKVYFYTLSKTHSQYLAEETTQLTFIKLWHYRGSLDESLPISQQIFRIAKTTCIDLLRKEAVQLKLLQARKQVDPRQTHISEAVEVKELQQRLADIVKNMPPVRRKVFEMSRYEFKSHKEIAQMLSLSVKTVENHIALALKQLRHFLMLLLLWVLFL
jgi:RNA polymerase sigma-70 factor, Bacteroides expansion family 1